MPQRPPDASGYGPSSGRRTFPPQRSAQHSADPHQEAAFCAPDATAAKAERFQVTEKPELLYGINEITTEVQALGFDAAGKLATRDVTLTLIPYYAWAHRGEGKMDVWLPVNRIDVE